jgi:phage terminase small subunit
MRQALHTVVQAMIIGFIDLCLEVRLGRARAKNPGEIKKIPEIAKIGKLGKEDPKWLSNIAAAMCRKVANS